MNTAATKAAYISDEQIIAAIKRACGEGSVRLLFAGKDGEEKVTDVARQFAKAITEVAQAELVGFAQFVLRGIKSGHVSNASFIDHDLDGEHIEVETLSSYAEKVLAKAAA